jgi:hypothetical protein
MTTILDPTDERTPVERQVFLDALEGLLAEKAPGIATRRYTKPTFAKPCPDALRHEIRDACDFLIEALAD